MQHELLVPPGFEALAKFSKWNLMTADERTKARREATGVELQEFYNEVLPHVEAILNECDLFPLGTLPASHQGIYNVALSIAEVAPHIEFYQGQVGVPYAFEEARFHAVHGNDETWQALPPNGPR